MPTYVIERTVPGAGQMDEADLASISAKSNQVPIRQIHATISPATAEVLG